MQRFKLSKVAELRRKPREIINYWIWRFKKGEYNLSDILWADQVRAGLTYRAFANISVAL